MLQIIAPKEPFDAVVVGSGATGGWAAKKLTAAGMRVALLEAGKKITPEDFTEHKPAWQLPYWGCLPRSVKNAPFRASATPAANPTTSGSSTTAKIHTRKKSRFTGSGSE